MTVVRLLLSLLLVVVMSGLALPHHRVLAQGPSSFQSGVDLVQLDVVVLDRDRHPVAGLTAADFTITEAGVAREIQAFAEVALPGRAPVAAGAAAWTRDVAPDVATNALPDAGRLAVIMLDHAIPVGPMTVTARRIAHAAVDALGPNDLAAVVRSNPIADDGLSQNFTADRTWLREAIDSPFMGLTKPPADGPTGGIDYVPSLDPELPYCHCGVCQWRALERVANALEETAGRHKAIFFVGREILVNEAATPDPTNTCDVVVSFARDRTLRALDRANVTVHVIDPSGLETLAATASRMLRVSPQQSLARQANLRVLPDYTGGRAIIGTNAPEEMLQEIVDESSHYYLIGLTRTAPPEVRRSSSTARHALRIRVNRPGVTVRSRTAYYSPATDEEATQPDDPTTTALASLLPRTDLPLTLGAATRFRPDGSARAAILLGLDKAVRERHLDETGGVFDVTIGVFDGQARLKGTERQTIDVPAAALRASEPVETATELVLDPGRYELRVAVTDIASDVTGTVHGYVAVPDDDEDVSLSGVAIERAGVPTLQRAFSSTDAVTASVQVRRRAAATIHAAVVARILDESGRSVFESVTPVDTAAFAGTRVADVRLALPTDALAPGSYLLTMETGAGDDRQQRSVRFDRGR